jgi:hypothetical protein
MRRTIALAVAGPVLVATLTGCGLLPQGQAGGGAERQATSQQPAAEATGPAAPTEAPAATAPPAQERVIASREVRTGSAGQFGKARLDITQLRRQGKTTSLNFTVTVLDGKINLHNGMGSHSLDYTVSQVSLIDPVNGKRYRVARNGTGEDAKCVCSGTQGMFLQDDQTVTLYAVFGAPPPDVTKVDVEMPMMGVFNDVPIS